mmetsp:Transcript_2173/g.14375  ORF Transcript_2173/g.14375 Transcript_2173/m.14375 type:complete len:330 (+) Transcript_2173:771-1760(+)
MVRWHGKGRAMNLTPAAYPSCANLPREAWMDPSSTAEIAWHRKQGYTPVLRKCRNAQIGIPKIRAWWIQICCAIFLNGASVRITGKNRCARLKLDQDTVELPHLRLSRTRCLTVPAALSARSDLREYVAMSDGWLHSTQWEDCNTCVHDVSWFVSIDGPDVFQCNVGSARLFDESDEFHAFVAKAMKNEREEPTTVRVARNVRTMRGLSWQMAQAQGGERRRRRMKRRRSDGDDDASRRRSPRLASFDAAVGAARDVGKMEGRKALKEKLQDLHIPGGWAGFDHELFRYEHMSEKALWTRMTKIKRLDKLKVSSWRGTTRSLGRCIALE